jgi:tetratricopeptide (TPR) repeat protein
LNLPNLKEEYGSSSYAVAILATFFWVANPVQVTTVTYIVQRMASMAGMFYIISMYFYLIGRTSETVWKKVSFFILCALSAVLAFGTKENAIMLPVSIYLYDLLLIQGITRENLLKGFKVFFLPLLLVGSVMLVFFVDIYSLLMIKDYAIRPFTMYERILTETRVIIFYISLLLYPVSSRLMLKHDFEISKALLEPWTTLAAIILILLCLGLSIVGARKKPLISYCILFFFLNHFIEGSIIPLELIYEHRNYIPSMFFFVPLAVYAAYILNYFSWRKYIQYAGAMLISILLFTQGHTVYMYNNLFKDPYLLWSDNVNKAPKLSLPHNNVAVELSRWELFDEAYKSYEKAYQLNRFDHLLMITHSIGNMGRYYFRKKDYEAAIVYFKKALDIDPQDSRAQVIFIKTKICMNELEDAEVNLQQALAKWPANTDFRALLSFILLKKGLYQEAIKEAWKTLTVDSEATDVKRVLGEAYRRKGLYERAVSLWEQYVTQHRNDLEGQLALIELYSKTGQTEILGRTIARVMILKGSKSWQEMIDEHSSESAAHAYVPDKRALLSIVKKNLLKDF